MQKTNPTGYTLETLCAAIGARLGLPLADQLRVQSRVVDRGMGCTYVLETDRTQTFSFRMTEAVESPAADQREDRVTLALADAADWLASEMRLQPEPERRTICMSDGLPVMPLPVGNGREE